MLEGLHAAHGLGIVHRDVKPANVFLCEDRGVNLIDFGLATRVTPRGDGGSDRELGTPRYMAAEQARGDAVDARSPRIRAAAPKARRRWPRRSATSHAPW